MILIDFNQIALSNILKFMSMKGSQLELNGIRFMILNSIRAYNVKFKKDYGDIIICADHRSWRKEFFPYYKAQRTEWKENSDLDWNLIFESLNQIRDEIDQFLPYKVIHIEGAEADDIIGTISHYKGSEELIIGDRILIISGDKDYIQLQKYANVQCFNPISKSFINHNNPEDYLFEHIVKGDKGDGVPNILSDDNSIILRIRQKAITTKRLNEMKNNLVLSTTRNFIRNKTLIDLSQTPTNIKNKIIEKFDEINSKNRSKLLDYFMKNSLRLMLDKINDF